MSLRLVAVGLALAVVAGSTPLLAATAESTPSTGSNASAPTATTTPGVLDAAALRAVARAALADWLVPRSARFSLAEVAGPASFPVPPGALVLTARRLTDNDSIAPRMQIWVDVVAAGRFVRSVPVAFEVHAWHSAWVATRDARAGAPLADAALERREVDLAQERAAPLARPPEPTRLRRPLLSGQMLAAAHVEPMPEVRRGALVTLRASAGAIGIEAQAEALQDGRAGQLVWVRPAAATGPVHARVVAEGIVEVSHE
jgi:flagella basal body P-ring formation protein FlgA